MSIIKQKVCSNCCRKKKYGDFRIVRKNKDGRSSKCIICENKSSRGRTAEKLKTLKQDIRAKEIEIFDFPPETPKISFYVFPGIVPDDTESFIKTRLLNLLNKICLHYKCDPNDVIGLTRKEEIVYVRHVFCYVTYIRIQKVTVTQIGKFLGGRDHTTAIHSKTVFKNLLDVDAPTPKKLKTAQPTTVADYKLLNQIL